MILLFNIATDDLEDEDETDLTFVQVKEGSNTSEVDSSGPEGDIHQDRERDWTCCSHCPLRPGLS